MKVLDQFFDFLRKGYSLSAESHPIIDLEIPKTLSFPLNCVKGATCASLVDRGDEVEYGQPIWDIDKRKVHPSPVSGKITDIVNVPDVRGDRIIPSITIEPSGKRFESPFPRLDPVSGSIDDLKKRIDEAGVETDKILPVPLMDVIKPESGEPVNAVVILAADREPSVVSYIQQFIERIDDTVSAAKMLARISGSQKVFLALPESIQRTSLTSIASEIDVLYIPEKYPESFDILVARKTGIAEGVKVVSIESALASLDAVREGKIQDRKVLTVIGPDKKIMGNYRVWIGTRFSEIFSKLGLKPQERDKVVAGGPMTGHAQYSLEGIVDSGTNALMLISAEEVFEWATEPCINCGKCVDVCPVNLQVQLIGRYSEFSLFERTKDYEIDQCIECGLCAAVCTARRPLLQLIDLAKRENAAAAAEEGEQAEAIPATVKGRRVLTEAENDPALSIFSGLPRFTVGFAPHWRTRADIFKMNLFFILALIPTLFISAASQFFGPLAADLSASTGPINDVLETVVIEMGLDAGFLWFSGVFGMCLFGAGLGVLVEYISQVAMRQPYYATDGHGALTGLLVALMMPPSIPLWVLTIAVIVAIVLGKQLFGGIGGYPMHPALVGWLVVLLSWPQYVYPIGSASIAAFSTAAVIATVIGGLALLATGYIRFEIPVGVLIGVIGFYFIFQGQLTGGLWEQLFTGHVFLGAFFLATDATVSPANRIPLWIYGIGTGILIMLIRAFGIWPDAVPFAILLMNILSPLIDRIKPKVIQVVG